MVVQHVRYNKKFYFHLQGVVDMAIQNQPTGNRGHVEFIRYLRPQGSQTVFWVQEMRTNRMYHLLRWGDNIYLPVGEGDHLGLGFYNGRQSWVAYPMYVEALNLWDGGQSEPEDCDTDHMWELKPYQRMVADALMNANAQVGRPLIVVQSGAGFAIGESTFGSTQWRGQIRIYERLVYGSGYQYQRETNEGFGTFGGLRGREEVGPQTMGIPKSFGEITRGGPAPKGGRAAIGAGEEEFRGHVETGVSYQRDSQPVVFLQTELREDLLDMLSRAWGTKWDWFWSMPSSESLWWDNPWTWSPHQHTSPQVPPAPRPHTGRH
jgi:hypothetical protein